MISKRIIGDNKKNHSVFVKRILSVPPILALTFLLVTQAFGYTSINVTPITMGYHSVPESSGTVSSRAYSGVYWMVSDYTGRPEQTSVYAVNSKGNTLGRFPVQGASNWNWEDIAIDANNNLWVCDIGDNNAVRSSYKLYKVPEPNPYGGSRTVYPSATYWFRLPDGSADMDSCFIWQGTPYLITNSPSPRLYKLPYLDSSKTVTAQLLATWHKDGYIGGADISADGKRLALAAIYSDNQWIIERSSSSGSVADFFTSPSREWKIHFHNGQGEGITFVNGKYDFVTVSESGGMWLVTQSMYGSSGPTSTTTTTTTTTASTSNKAYKLYFEGYDYDNAKEVTITLNGKVVASLPSTYMSGNNNAWISYSMYITGSVISGTNTLIFKQSIYSSCVRNLRIVETSSGQTIYSYSSQRCITAGSTPSVSYTFNAS
ncbi:MAG: hypothetical protein M1503_00905 [Thaumarchaeota archaeon]|nr:hypothetical protein [Nitrososphaerota archaeon]MCL5316813.1 hypothetical protein [Nitrososphaerota archaeon]